MSMSYVRKYYGVPASRGRRVMVETWVGWVVATIVSADHRVTVKPDVKPLMRLTYHPLDVLYIYL